MARSVEIFRENAIAKKRAEDDLRASKERAEKALAELRLAQRSLIEAEKLAALGVLPGSRTRSIIRWASV